MNIVEIGFIRNKALSSNEPNLSENIKKISTNQIQIENEEIEIDTWKTSVANRKQL